MSLICHVGNDLEVEPKSIQRFKSLASERLKIRREKRRKRKFRGRWTRREGEKEDDLM